MALPDLRPPRSLPLAIQVAENAMQEFLKRWVSGFQPCLLLETNHAGQILVTSKVSVAANDRKPLFPHPHTEQVLHRHLPRTHRDSPSRRRRRERRARARQAPETAAAQADQAAPQDVQAAVIAAAPQLSPPPSAVIVAASNAHENVDDEMDDTASIESYPSGTPGYPPQLHSSDYVSRNKPVHLVSQPKPTAAQAPLHLVRDAAQAPLHLLVRGAAQAPLHLVRDAAQAHPQHPVQDELCQDQDFCEYLEAQRMMKEKKIRELSTKMNFGFKPKNTKKPF